MDRCPLAFSDDGFTYFLAGALRLPGFPLLIDVKLLSTRTSTEACDELEKMVAFFELLTFLSLQLDNLLGTNTVESISPEAKEKIKAATRAAGKKYIELSSKGVFTIKPDKYKVRKQNP